MKKIITIISALVVSVSMQTKAQNVYIPDANFKAALVGKTKINTNGDTAIQVSEAAAYYGTINVISKKIKDLTGIEAFMNVDSLDCSYNNLTSLDVSKNTTLTYLATNLNQLSTLDISANKALTFLACNRNQLTSLDVSKNVTLAFLDCSRNYNLSSLTLSTVFSLIDLDCSYNSLTSLKLSSHEELEYLDCSDNQLSDLNFSLNISLEYLDCTNNILESLNIQNDNNTILVWLDCLGNDYLTCIQVDDILNSNEKVNWRKEEFTIYSTDCNYSGIAETGTPILTIFPNPTNSNLTISGLTTANQTINITNILGESVQTVTTNGVNQLMINLSNLPNCLYFIRVGGMSYKFIKN